MNGTLWYYSTGTSELGPVTADELTFLVQTGTIGPKTLVRADGSTSRVAFQRSQLAKAIRNENRKTPTSAASVAQFRSKSGSSLVLRRNTAFTTQSPEHSVAADVLPLPTAEHGANRDRRRGFAVAAAAAAVLLALILWFLRPQQPGGFAGTGDGTGIADSGTGQSGEQQGIVAADAASLNAQPAAASTTPAPAATAAENMETSNTSTASAETPVSPSEIPAEKTESAQTQESGRGLDAPSDTLASNGLAVGRGTDQRFSISAPGETTFFGTRGSGKRFSWVVDCSGSMSGIPLQLSLSPLQRAKQELLQSLRRLPQGLEFQIIFFDDFCYRFPSMGFVEVSPDTLREAADFINNIQGGGGTNVQIGMQQALAGSTRPDTVFLLTDGAFDTGTPGFIASRNRNQQTRINTVAFIDRAGESLLRQIADENRGDFRFVP
jgi:hypothetical protein